MSRCLGDREMGACKEEPPSAKRVAETGFPPTLAAAETSIVLAREIALFSTGKSVLYMEQREREQAGRVMSGEEDLENVFSHSSCLRLACPARDFWQVPGVLEKPFSSYLFPREKRGDRLRSSHLVLLTGQLVQ